MSELDIQLEEETKDVSVTEMMKAVDSMKVKTEIDTKHNPEEIGNI